MLEPTTKTAIVTSGPRIIGLFLFSLFTFHSSLFAAAQPRQHPCLLLTPQEKSTILSNLGAFPLFDTTFADALHTMDAALAETIDVPIPKDAAGYTHETHKRNAALMQTAGFLYQITGDKKYFTYVKTLLDRYAALYPTLTKHPAAKDQAYGRLFWQSLNETVWLVNVSQAYDCVYTDLSPADRARYEETLFRPMVKFLAENQGNELDRIHNHGTWVCAAVAMIGYVMGDDDMVQKALYGSRKDGSAGYLRQLDLLFSPDGYYCEGPYYARYALMPFFLVAQVIENNQPDLKIFERRDHILTKALNVLLQQSWLDGQFLPLNDSLKDKSWRSSEIVFALAITYAQTHDDTLLPVAYDQHTVAFTAAGLEVAAALCSAGSAEFPLGGRREAPPKPPSGNSAFPDSFPYRSLILRDGPDGTRGGLALLRTGPKPQRDTLLTLKYTALGMEHGHYDKLSITYYADGVFSGMIRE